jgi:hypothetical protein
MTSSRRWRISLRQLGVLAGDAPFYEPRAFVDGEPVVVDSDEEAGSSAIVVL